MLAAVARKTAPIALSGIVVACILAAGNKHRELGPNDPISADGSMTAGRAATIHDTNPLFRERLAQNPDDPAEFEPLIKTEHPFVERDRALFKGLHGRLDWSLCQGSGRRQLMLAVRTYYQERGRLTAEFSHRGVRAGAAMEREWSTPGDREIDDYVRHLIQYGIVHKRDFPLPNHAEFNRIFAGTQELGAGCTADNRQRQ
jgi:hypothetical protein